VELSEFERRELDLIGAALEIDDPRLGQLLGPGTFSMPRRRAVRHALLILVGGLFVLVTGQLLQFPWVGILGFTIMSAAGYWATRSVRWGGSHRSETELKGQSE